MLVTYIAWRAAVIEVVLMAVTHVSVDDEVLEKVLALSKARTKPEAVNLALAFYAEQHERAAPIDRHFARAEHWGAVEEADRCHRAEKDNQ